MNVSATGATRERLAALQELFAEREEREHVPASEVIARVIADALGRAEADPDWLPSEQGYASGALRWVGVHTCVASGPDAAARVAAAIGDGVLIEAGRSVRGIQTAGVGPADRELATAVVVGGQVCAESRGSLDCAGGEA